MEKTPRCLNTLQSQLGYDGDAATEARQAAPAVRLGSSQSHGLWLPSHKHVGTRVVTSCVTCVACVPHQQHCPDESTRCCRLSSRAKKQRLPLQQKTKEKTQKCLQNTGVFKMGHVAADPVTMGCPRSLLPACVHLSRLLPVTPHVLWTSVNAHGA